MFSKSSIGQGYGMHIDNAIIHVEGPEIPIMDGSSMPFVKLIEKAGIRTLDASRKIIKVNLMENGGYRMINLYEMEIKDAKKPAYIAETISLVFP